MSLKRGALIVFEGIDRSGKSTQCHKLVERLQKCGKQVQLFIFPDRSTSTGKLINRYLTDKDCKLHDKAIHLLFAANRWENVDKMKKLLYSGVTLIVDRYSYSGIAYSSIKPGMDFEWCKSQEIGLPKPDAVFLLSCNEFNVEERSGFGNERYEKHSIQMQVFDAYNKLKDNTWEVVDASANVESLHENLLKKVNLVIDKVSSTELQTLTFDDNAIQKENILSHSNIKS